VSLSNFERYQRIAWAYDLLDLPFEYGRYRKIRPLLFRGLSGRILEAPRHRCLGDGDLATG
jgi:hypothetical protein